MKLFDILGFQWDRTALPTQIAIYDIKRVCFRLHRMLAEFVWDAGVLEGNPYTFPQVQTLLDGVTIGGHKLSNQEQILNLAASTKKLLELVSTNAFHLDKSTFCDLHSLVARHETLEWGHFRGEGQEICYTPDVSLGTYGRYTPPITQSQGLNLLQLFQQGIDILNKEIQQPFEKACIFFLFGALQQFFFDGNKRTSRLMMNGILMSHGIDAISIPAAKVQAFNEKMVRFYLNKDGTEMLDFINHCRSI